MDTQSVEYRSIFDIMEEYSDSPETFRWVKNSSLLSYNTDELLYEGELLTDNGLDESLKINRFVLTYSLLIKHRVINVNTYFRKEIAPVQLQLLS